MAPMATLDPRKTRSPEHGLDDVAVAVIVVGHDDRLLVCNAAAGRLLGIAADRALGRDLAEVAPGPALGPIQAGLARARREQATATLDRLVWPRAGGDAITVRPTFTPSGDRDAVVVTLEDRREADVAERRHAEFLAMLAHELRNPLAPILTAATVLRRALAGDLTGGRALQVVERQVRHLGRLVDDLLDVVRITHGKIELQREPVDLSAAVSEALAATEHLFRSGRHRVDRHLPGEAPVVVGDPTRLVQIFANLLNNAAKFTPPGGHIDVAVAVESGGDSPNGAAVVRIKDTGIGLAPDLRPQVFSMFTQGESSIARSRGGLGIGLALVRQLVDLHGGQVAVHSEGLGRGSEFVVRMPLAPAGALPARREAVRSAPLAPPRRILIVEDNRDARQMLRIALELDGHAVHDAIHGRQGVLLARTLSPDIVLVDLGLPGMDGFEVGRAIRTALGDAVLLIALTGYGSHEARERTRGAGFDMHLVKPVDPAALTQAIAAGRQGASRG
jgi:PAS domain S-box-containing protein